MSLLSDDEEKVQTSKPPVFREGHADMSLDSDIKDLIAEVGTSQGAVSKDDHDDDDVDDDSDDENDKMVLRSGKRVSFLKKMCNEQNKGEYIRPSIIRSMS